MFRFCMPGPHDEEEENESNNNEPKVAYLVEVVGAMGLDHNTTMLSNNRGAGRGGVIINPYCIVKLGHSKEIHRTKTIYNDPNPIWTIQTKSLCRLDLPQNYDCSTNTTSTTTTQHRNERKHHNLTVEVCHGKQVLGRVVLPIRDVIRNARDGERLEYDIKLSSTETSIETNESLSERTTTTQASTSTVSPPTIPIIPCTLALRFRKASPEELLVLGNTLESSSSRRSSRSEQDQNSPLMVAPEREQQEEEQGLAWRRTSQKKECFPRYNIRFEDKPIVERVFRVRPYPDEDRPKETTYMTREDIFQEALKPSRKWTEAGCGGDDDDVGTIYLEVIGCDKLPNMDMGYKNLTDAFVGILFEDNLLRTDVINDSLNPRWMPWTTRAFALNVRHPSSLLMLGVFDDFDDNIVKKSHDPIGRVVIDMANFETDTSYLLHYPLYHDSHDPSQNNNGRCGGCFNCGSITVRLRIDWKKQAEAIKKSFAIPPRFMINVPNGSSFRVLRYLARGAVDLEKPSIASIQLWAKELLSYWTHICYTLDVVAEILLWRGRTNISFFVYLLGRKKKKTVTYNVWFPIRSALLFAAVVIAIERPRFIPPLLLMSIAWILLTINYYASRHPCPWKRVKSVHETNTVLWTGQSVHPPIIVEQGAGVDEAAKLELVDKLKAERVSIFLKGLVEDLQSLLRMYEKSDILKIDISRGTREWSLFGDHLKGANEALSNICRNLRAFRNLLNWKGYWSHKVTMNCIFIAILWLLLPVSTVVHWAIRISAWALLGPWMKLLDICYVHPYYRTYEELIDHTELISPEGSPLLSGVCAKIMESKRIQQVGKMGRIAAEDALKLKDMREHMYGRWSLRVPLVDTSRYPSIPTPASTAVPYKKRNTRKKYTKFFEDLPPDQQKWYFVRGQRLDSHMMLQTKGKID